jgi:hypothetical protein
MLRRLFFPFALCFLLYSSSALSQIDFNRRISLATFQTMMLPPDVDGDYLVVGDTQLFGGWETIALRLDSAGQTKAGWRLSTMPSLSNIRPNSITRLADGRAVLVGYGNFAQKDHGFVCILDSSGQGTTASRLDFINGTQWSNVVATPDSGFVVSGSGMTNSFYNVALVARYDKHLNPVWGYQLSSANHIHYTQSVAVLPDGGIILGGSLFNSASQIEIFLANLDASGNLRWGKTYTSPQLTSFSIQSMQYDGQDKLYLSGLSIGAAASFNVFVHLAIDTAGTFLWGNAVGDPNGEWLIAENMLAGHGGTWILHGSRQTQSGPNEGMSLAFSSSGSVLWATTAGFGGGYDEHVEDVVPHPDGGYVWLIDQSTGHRILKTDAQGLMTLPCGPFPLNVIASPFTLNASSTTFNVSSGFTHTPLAVLNTSYGGGNWPDCPILDKQISPAKVSAQVLPQPMRSSARILLTEGTLEDGAHLHFTDLNGRHLSLPATRLPDGWEVQRGGLPAGIYAYQVLQEGQRIASGRLWVAD